jgi:hypothetical protein
MHSLPDDNMREMQVLTLQQTSRLHRILPRHATRNHLLRRRGANLRL